MPAWHTSTQADVIARLQTDQETGLVAEEAARRLAEYGSNRLEEKAGRHPLTILAGQLTDVMVIILIVSAVISYFLGDIKDTGAILVIVILNALLGFSQEYRAERAMAALKQLVVPTVRARRDGHGQPHSCGRAPPGGKQFQGR
jgi:Ca2+-transporting ATPase